MVSFKDLKVNEFIGEFDCFCGQRHSIKTEIIFSKNAIENLSEKVAKILPAGNILYITANDLKEKSRNIEKILYKTHMLDIVEFEPNFKPSLEHIAKLTETSEECKLIICFGGENIASIGKYFASLKYMPLICIVSDISSVSYLSDFSEFYNNGLKQRLKSTSPDILLADLNIMLECPKNIIAAGYGTVLGSALGLFDRQVANILNGEAICENITDLVKKALENVKLAQNKLIDVRPDSIEILAESLLYLNLACCFAGQNICGAGYGVADILELILKNKNKLSGELLYLSLNKLIRIYELFLNSIPTDLLAPADFCGRASKLSELTGIHELEFLKEFKEKKEYNREVYIHKLLEYKDELRNAIAAADKSINNTLTVFKRIYTDKGYSIQNCFSSDDFKKAVYLAPAVDKKFTLLSFITDLGYLENLV